MARPKSSTAKLKELNDYIWSLQGKSDGIIETNRNLILQYCRFVIMADESSQQIEECLKNGELGKVEELIKIHEKLNRTMLSLYKTLKLDEVKSDKTNPDNPFLELLKEDEDDL